MKTKNITIHKSTFLASVFLFLALLTGQTVWGQDNEELFSRAKLLIDNRRYEEAINTLNEVIAKEPSKTDAYTARARAYSMQGKSTEALADAAKVSKLCSDCSSAYILRGNIYLTQKKYDEALEDFTKAIGKADSNEYLATLNRGQLYAEINNFDKAMLDFNRTVELNNKSVDAYIERARVNNNYYKNHAAAINDATAAFKLAPNNGTALLQRGYAFKMLKNWRSAEFDYSRAIILGAGNANSYVNRGEIYEQLKRPDLALADYRKAIELDPNHELGKKNLAKLAAGEVVTQ